MVKPADGVSGVAPPLEDLARIVQQGRLGGVTIEYWVGGGLPPPHYRSDQLRLLTFESSDILEFARPYRDPAATREGIVEKFHLAVQPSDVRRIATLIIDIGVFERQFPEEKDPGRADALTTEVILTINGREFKRRYYSGSPPPLEPLRLEVERLIRRLVESGKREVSGGAGAKPETIPLSKMAEEVGKRIDRDLLPRGRLALWLNVASYSSPDVVATANAVRRILEVKPGIVFVRRVSAGAAPVPSGDPGGHVHMLSYVFEPHPDMVINVGEMDGRVAIDAHDAGKDPAAPPSSWRWILRAP